MIRSCKPLSIALCLFIMVSFTGAGCGEDSEPKPDYITVVVSSSIETLACLPDGTNYQTDGSYQVRLEMIKAGGERFVFDLTSDNGWTETKKGSFKLYREQFIDVVATIQGGTWDRKSRTLLWKEVYPTVDFGKEYFWIAHLSLCVTDE